jgi:hypothetical protein
MGKLFILIGTVLLIVGLIMQFDIKIPYIGKLPGDIAIEKEHFSFYFPITSSILISIVLIAIFYVIGKFR